MIEQKLEMVIKFVVDKLSDTKDLIKPTLFHSIRVGMYLYEKWYDESVCVAWFLHDIMEDTNTSDVEIKQLFWEYILKLVQANTKNSDLPKEERKDELISRCANAWQDSLIIKCADIIDNYGYWTRQQRKDEVERCRTLTDLIKKHKTESYQDPIFQTLFNLF